MLTTAPIRVFLPNADGLRFLWRKFDDPTFRSGLTDELPADAIGFCTWLLQPDAQAFLVGGTEEDAETSQGLFLFTGIEVNNSAFAHIFVWDKEGMKPKDLVDSARQACAAVMTAHGLARISGLTPTTLVPARVFAERVGFKIEGTVRKALVHGGMRVNAWISGLLREDIPEYFPDDDTIEE